MNKKLTSILIVLISINLFSQDYNTSTFNNAINFDLIKSDNEDDSQEFKEKKERWIKLLKSDIYINEGVNVLLNLKTKKINQRSILAKVD